MYIYHIQGILYIMIYNIPTFRHGNTDIDQVKDYTDLGICLKWNGFFVQAKRCLPDEASNAIYLLSQNSGD